MLSSERTESRGKYPVIPALCVTTWPVTLTFPFSAVCSKRIGSHEWWQLQ